MTGGVRIVTLLALAVILGLVSGCDGFLTNKPGKITVTNTGSEVAVIAVLAGDAKSYPTLGPGASAVVSTATGGAYQVIVIMSAIDAQNYRNNLQTLKQNVLKIVDGSASHDEKILYFQYLAQINSAIAQAQNAGGASCSGKVTLSEESTAAVSVAVEWIPTLGSGSWSLTCGSN